MSDVEVKSKGAHATNKRMLRQVGARVIEAKEQDVPVSKRTVVDAGQPGASKTLPQGGRLPDAGDGAIIEPPFNLLTLTMLEEHSSELRQCIEAMSTNIDGFGHRQLPRVKASDIDGDDNKKAELKAEIIKLTNFFEYATGDVSFTQHRKIMRKDLEATGNAYQEIIRSSLGAIQQWVHVPSYQMRLTKTDDKPTLWKRMISCLQDDGSVEVATVDEWKRFRRYVQLPSLQSMGGGIVTAGRRWFKEFGDPRILDCRTGVHYANEAEAAKAGCTPDFYANEMVHFAIPCARSPYGLPRYIGNLLSVFGDRAAEEINYTTFRNNNIPSMLVTVSNGMLTQGTVDRIQSFVESQIQGSDNMSKFLIIEGESDSEDGEDGGQVRIEVKPLTAAQHTDAMFQSYSSNNQDKIRRAYRLPPILVGRPDENSKANAAIAVRLADEQVFAPERDDYDSWINRVIYPNMGIKHHLFKSNSPNTTDNTQLVSILASAEKTGGITPRIARRIMEGILGESLPDFVVDKEGVSKYDPDVPFSMTMAQAVKNLADPTEPGQQVTALKRLTEHFQEVLDVDDPLMATLLAVHKSMEERWRDVGAAA